MNDMRKLRRLSRLKLLEIMYEQEKQLRHLEAKNDYLKDYIKSQNKAIKEQMEIINLLSKLTNHNRQIDYLSHSTESPPTRTDLGDVDLDKDMPTLKR